MSDFLATRRARVYPTDAIALKRMDFSEADRIITIFTPEHGKFRVLAKGVRRSTSRMAGHLDDLAGCVIVDTNMFHQPVDGVVQDRCV